jgi:hypothetical protein
VRSSPAWSAIGPLGAGATWLYEGHNYFKEIWTQDKIYIYIYTYIGRHFTFSNTKHVLFRTLNFTNMYINLEKYVIH